MKKIKKIMSILLVFVIMIPYLANMAVSAEEAEKYPYMMFGRNGITMSASSNLCINGNVHTNKEADITSNGGNINGKITTGADIEKELSTFTPTQKSVKRISLKTVSFTRTAIPVPK